MQDYARFNCELENVLLWLIACGTFVQGKVTAIHDNLDEGFHPSERCVN